MLFFTGQQQYVTMYKGAKSYGAPVSQVCFVLLLQGGACWSSCRELFFLIKGPFATVVRFVLNEEVLGGFKTLF